MKKSAAATAVAALLAFALPSVALACEAHKQQAQKDAAKAVKKVTVAELTKWQKVSKPMLLDANSAETRQKLGVIPGATLLTSSVTYDVVKELPAAKDSKLVFYCASDKCTSSQQAAERATTAGYTDVSILPDGVQGWKRAGHKTSVPQS